MNQPEVQRERKRRKWDVPAPEAAPTAVAPNSLGAGVDPGSIGLSATLASRPPLVRAGQPPDPDAIKRAQAAALAVVSKLNKVGAFCGFHAHSHVAGFAPTTSLVLFHGSHRLDRSCLMRTGGPGVGYFLMLVVFLSLGTR